MSDHPITPEPCDVELLVALFDLSDSHRRRGAGGHPARHPARHLCRCPRRSGEAGMIRTNPSIRAIALAEFTRRRAGWQKACREGAADWPGDEANRQLTLWVAIALAAGVGRDLPADVCAQIEEEALHPVGGKFLPCADRVAARLLSDPRDLTTARRLWLDELTAERDRLRARAEQSGNTPLIQRAIDLTRLAEALGAPGIDLALGEGRAAA